MVRNAILLRTLLVALAWLCAAAPARAADAAASVIVDELTSTELAQRVRAGAKTVLVPIGGTEQSGSHIALGKHNARVHALATRIAETLGNTLVAPVVSYVPEGAIDPPTAHMRYPGTISVPPPAFEQVLVAAAQSLRAAGFTTIVLRGDQGGPQGSLQAAATRLNRQWRASGVQVLAPVEYYRAASTGFTQLLRAR